MDIVSLKCPLLTRDVTASIHTCSENNINTSFACVVQERVRVTSPNCAALRAYEYVTNFRSLLGVVWQMVPVLYGCET